MRDSKPQLRPDPELARHLRALDEPISPERIAVLRSRVLAAAAPRLAERRSRRPSWLDITGGFGRIAIPLSLAAALLAMAILRALPQVQIVDETTMAMASTVVGDSASTLDIADELLLPIDADAVLLAPAAGEARQ
jgi:hypothetical protein